MRQDSGWDDLELMLALQKHSANGEAVVLYLVSALLAELHRELLDSRNKFMVKVWTSPPQPRARTHSHMGTREQRRPVLWQTCAHLHMPNLTDGDGWTARRRL